jgi:hypothetical protein
MKKNIFLITAIVCAALFTQAQETRTSHHDIRIMVNNIANKNQNDFFEWLFYYDWFDYDYFYYNLPNDFYNKKNYGLGYRYRTGNNALRFNIGFNYTTQKNDKNSADPYSSSALSKLKYSLMDMYTCLGYQRDFVFDKVHVYVGADVKYNYMLFDEDYTIAYSPAYNPHYTDYSIKNSTMGFGGGPFIGAEYFIVPALSVSTETGFDYFYEKISAKYKAAPNNDIPNESKREDTRQNFKFNPLSTISINIHL